jgi:hypothetical protein
VQAVEDGKVKLRGGLSLGLQQGCELVRTDKNDKKGTRIKITAPPNLSSAVATIVSGPPPRVGDLFVLEHWTVPQDIETRFFLPSTGLLSLEALRAAATMIRSAAASWHWIDDPTKETPDAVVRYENGAWEIERRKGPQTGVSSLGKSPTAAEWTAALSSGQGNLFVDFPPPEEFVKALKAKNEPGADAVHYVEKRSGALYALTGRFVAKDDGFDFEYSWLLSNTDARDEGNTPLPIRTDWFAVSDADVAAAQLEQRTLNLARLRLWLQVSVPGGGSNPFPYTLALRNQATGEIKTDGRLVEGEKYDLILRSTPEKLKEAAAYPSAMPQWIYVAAIDQRGRMHTVFPRQFNSGANHLPLSGSPPDMTLVAGIPIGEPFGTDTLILLTSEEEISPAALQIDPVLTRGSRGKGADGSVNRLLFRMQGGSRGEGDPEPTNWNLQRLTFHSVAKTTAGQ